MENSPPDAEARRKKRPEPTEEQIRLMEEAREEAGSDGWLCRFADEVGQDRPTCRQAGDGLAPEAGGGGARTVLGMGFADYLELLEWTGRCVVEGKRGVLPESARPVLERMELDVENWVGTVERYGSLYWRVAGKVENLKRKALEMGHRWLAGQRRSRGVFRRRPATAENWRKPGRSDFLRWD